MSNDPVRVISSSVVVPGRGIPSDLKVASLADLITKQDDVIKRVNKMANGAALFALHPIQAMQDAGVVLAPVAVQDVWNTLDSPAIPVPTAYKVLQKTTTPQKITFTLSSLFTRGGR